MILTFAIIFTLAGLGITGGSAYQYIVIARYAQDQVLPATTMIAGAVLLAAGGIMFCQWAAARRMAKLLEKPAGSPDPSAVNHAIAEALGSIYKSSTRSNELLEKLITRIASMQTRPPEAPSPLKLFYYADAQMKPQGPFTGVTLREMLGSGAITRETQIVVSGSDQWAPLSNYPELVG